MDILVFPDPHKAVPGANISCGRLIFNKLKFPCALGKNGISIKKSEGDLITPLGRFPLRQVFYRDDRREIPRTFLPTRPLSPNDGWCDDPQDQRYNQFVTLPHKGRCENLWRNDHLYDIILVMGFNDDRVEPGKGSALFIHLARENYAPTQGCIALAREDLLALLGVITPETFIDIRQAP